MPPTATTAELRCRGWPCAGIGAHWGIGHGGGACGGAGACLHPLGWAAAWAYIWAVSGGAAGGVGCWYAGAGCGASVGAPGWGGRRSELGLASVFSAAPHSRQ
jgi:hypothetical protein